MLSLKFEAMLKTYLYLHTFPGEKEERTENNCCTWEEPTLITRTYEMKCAWIEREVRGKVRPLGAICAWLMIDK